VETTADDQILLAVNNECISVVVDPAHITRAEPPGHNGFRGVIRTTPIALHDVVPADGDFPDHPWGHLGAVLVQHPELDAGDGGADGSRLAHPAGVVERRNG